MSIIVFIVGAALGSTIPALGGWLWNSAPTTPPENAHVVAQDVDSSLVPVRKQVVIDIISDKRPILRKTPPLEKHTHGRENEYFTTALLNRFKNANPV